MGFELLIPFLGSLLVVMGLRQLDKANSHTGHLRNFTQKLMEELHKTALSKVQTLKDVRTDLELLIKQSRKQNEDTQALLGHVQSYWEDMQSGKAELDQLRGEIQWMGKTAENLQKQKRDLENGIVYLQNHKEEIISISQDLTTLREEAESILTAFSEKLNIRSDELLNSLAHKISEMEKLLKTKTEGIDRSIEEFSQFSKDKLETIAENLIEETLERAERGKKNSKVF